MYASTKELANRIFNQLYGGETFWEKAIKVCRSPHSRIARIDHKGAHHTEYVLGLLNTHDGPIYLPVVCKTISMMEFNGRP